MYGSNGRNVNLAGNQPVLWFLNNLISEVWLREVEGVKWQRDYLHNEIAGF
jgi:hypothetical protein